MRGWADGGRGTTLTRPTRRVAVSRWAAGKLGDVLHQSGRRFPTRACLSRRYSAAPGTLLHDFAVNIVCTWCVEMALMPSPFYLLVRILPYCRHVFWRGPACATNVFLFGQNWPHSYYERWPWRGGGGNGLGVGQNGAAARGDGVGACLRAGLSRARTVGWR